MYVPPAFDVDVLSPCVDEDASLGRDTGPECAEKPHWHPRHRFPADPVEDRGRFLRPPSRDCSEDDPTRRRPVEDPPSPHLC